MNKHEKRAQEYEEKHMPKAPTKGNLKQLNELCRQLGDNEKLHKDLSEQIKDLKLPSLVVNFAMEHPNMEVTGTTDKLCSVFCIADNLTRMPVGASDIHIEDDKINFKVLLD